MQKYIVEVSECKTLWMNESGQPHRLDGPAYEYASGYKEYWIDGTELTESEFNQRSCIPNEVTINGVVYKRQ